jgi:hypothetical protein
MKKKIISLNIIKVSLNNNSEFQTSKLIICEK